MYFLPCLNKDDDDDDDDDIYSLSDGGLIVMVKKRHFLARPHHVIFFFARCYFSRLYKVLFPLYILASSRLTNCAAHLNLWSLST